MKQNDILLALGLTAAVVVGLVVYNSKDDEALDETFVPETPVSPAPQVPAVLNLNLVLKSGSRGSEVIELQKLLGAAPDGIFGPITENLLFAKKGVRSISLAQYKAKADVPKNPLKVGDVVMANKKPEVIGYENKTLANGQYSNTGKEFTTFDYGDKIGSIRAITNDRLHYVVEVNRPLVKNYFVWVKATEVLKI